VTRDEIRDQAVDDARLTPEALRVVLHVWKLGDGEHAVKGETLAILLGAGEKPIRAAITRAAHLGYIVHRRGGAAGHYLALAENPSPGGGIPDKESLPQGRNSAKITPPGEEFGPPSSSSSSPSSTRGSAREGDEALAALRTLLGDQAGVLDKFDRSAAHGDGWPAAVWGFYRPPGAAGEHDGGGTQWGSVLGRLGERTLAVGALALALDDYANKKHVFEARLFRGFVEKAALETKRRAVSMDAPARASPAFGRGGRKAGPQDAQVYTPTESFEGFNG
jgi:hypothetical protein